MKRRLASLFFLLVLVGSAFAGVPLHFGEPECGMTTMAGMDCCQAALLQTQTAEVADAKLCCALSCAQNGTTSPPTSTQISPPDPVGLIEYPAPAPTTLRSGLSYAIHSQHGPPGSPPHYLLNLAFLI